MGPSPHFGHQIPFLCFWDFDEGMRETAPLRARRRMKRVSEGSNSAIYLYTFAMSRRLMLYETVWTEPHGRGDGLLRMGSRYERRCDAVGNGDGRVAISVLKHHHVGSICGERA